MNVFQNTTEKSVCGSRSSRYVALGKDVFSARRRVQFLMSEVCLGANTGTIPVSYSKWSGSSVKARSRRYTATFSGVLLSG